MSEMKARLQLVTNTVEKAIAKQASRLGAAADEVQKLQSDGITQAGLAVDIAIQLANEQLAFWERLATEWRGLVLAVTRRAVDVLDKKG